MSKTRNYLEILYDLHHSLNSSISLEEILNQICSKVAEVFSIPQVVIFLAQEDGKSAKIVAEKRKEGLPSQLGQVHKFSEHPTTAKIIQKKWTLNVKDTARTNKLEDASSKALQKLGITSLLGVPIVASNEAVGILFLDRLEEKKPYTKKEVALAELIAGEVGEAVVRGQLFAKVEALSAKLKQFSEWTLGKEVVKKGLKTPEALELRPARKVMAFMDIRGFTLFSENHDSKMVAEVITNLYELCERSAEKFGGQLFEVKGDEIFLIFDNLEKALSALLVAREAVAGYLAPHGLAVGIGINEGEVLIGMLGTKKHKSYRVVGSAINIAKGLERLAKNNEIFVPKDLYLKTRKKFDYRYLGPLEIKGKVVDAYCLISSH
ncbi:MAG: adenylate/guanylate cyclase domain-containing protein [bacterium]|nr:adenylate/guanylate cyclase domain-containing protein [bacterium]